MATPTYVPLATITLASTDSEIVFSSIPATYRDLIVVFQGGNTGSIANLLQKFNSDTNNANYSVVQMSGTGSTTSSTTPTAGSSFTTTFYGYLEQNLNANVIIQIMDYSATDKHKAFLSRASSASNGVTAIAGRWANTTAINSISYSASVADLRIGTTISLFGVN